MRAMARSVNTVAFQSKDERTFCARGIGKGKDRSQRIFEVGRVERGGALAKSCMTKTRIGEIE